MKLFHLVLAFQLWIIRIYILPTDAKTYVFPKGWEVRNTKELPGDGTRYRLLQLSNKSEQVVSQNGRFGLSFFTFSSSSQYYFAVVLITGNFSSSITCVWAANRDNPVAENSVVRLSDQGELQLLDSEGTSVWKSPPGVSSIDVRDDGNILLYNFNGDVLWQSFNQPTDVLLPGQAMVTGQSLVSSSNSSTLSSGKIRFEVMSSGIIFFLTLDDTPPQPFYVRPMWNGNLPTDVTSINKSCPSYRAVLGYSSGQVTLNYEAIINNTSDQPCGPPVFLGLGSSNTSDFHYLKLENDGNLMSYVYEPRQSAWREDQPVFTNVLGSCLPMTCQPHSVCSGNASSRDQCGCINVEGNQQQQQEEEEVCPSLSTIPLTCNNEVEAENHHFFNVTGAGYFSNNYTKADRVSTLPDCWTACLANCSCRALFYNKRTQSCFFVENVYGGLTRDPNFDAFLKLQNSELFVPRRPRDRARIIGVTVGAALVLLSTLGLIGLRIWKHKLDKDARMLAVALQGSAQKFTYKELEVATDNFSRCLGRGGYGSVYEGAFTEGRKVAVKRLEGGNLQKEKGFIAEMTSLGRISHQNVVQLYGFCSEKKELMLVYEYMVNGSLDKWLFNDKENRCLDWDSRKSIALGLARGLAYLHEEARQLIIHLDIKPENVLLDENFRPKLSDFGLAKLLKSREVSQTITIRGTPGYLAPEWLLYSTATKKCDVYSYGMVLLELIGGRRNLLKFGVDTTAEESLWWYFPAWVVACVKTNEFLQVVDSKIRDGVPQDEAKRLIHVALWCLQENPTQRPSMDAVVQMLLGRKEIPEPPLFFRFALRSSGVLRFSSTASSGVSVMVSDLARA